MRKKNGHMPLNCWEFKKCGRELKGARAGERGICPAAVHFPSNGVNGGKNGGRYCWALVGTLCEGKAPDSLAVKRENCLVCRFFQRVKREQGEQFIF